MVLIVVAFIVVVVELVLTTMLLPVQFFDPMESVTQTLNVYVPSALGVPLRVPVAPLKLRPGGSAPETL